MTSLLIVSLGISTFPNIRVKDLAIHVHDSNHTFLVERSQSRELSMLMCIYKAGVYPNYKCL
jgi:hypothetical protein